jgi:glycosyltransferase involved in cell wall biosynthesis
VSAATDLRVLLDATAIPAERGGVGRYVDELAAALNMTGTRLTIACQASDADVFATLAPASRIVPVAAELRSRGLRFGWEQTGLPLLARKVRAQVVHSPHYTLPLASPVPVVCTLHDATFFSDRELHLGVKGRFFRSWTRVALRRAAVCVVPSEATADELVRLAGARRDRLMVAYHGVDTGIFAPPDAEDVALLRRRLELDSDWVAFLGTVEPRKNVPALIRGFVQAVADRADRPALVLAGSPGWDADVEPALAAVPDGIRVLRTGHLPLTLLPALLGGAEVVAYPSLGEGFGLPVLEAMACRATVLTTRRLSLPEVGGDAVAYTGVTDREIGTALGELLDDPVRRAELADAAALRARRFSWAESARVHQQAYRRAVGR